MPAEKGYCVKCRKKREIVNPKTVSFKSRGGSRKALKGTCPVCGTKIFRILGK